VVEVQERFEPFVAEEIEVIIQNDAHEPKNVTDPVSNAIVELRWGEGVRYAIPDSNGRFVFDVLPKGQYTIAAYAPGFPRTMDLPAGPKRVNVEEKSCSDPSHPKDAKAVAVL